MMISRRTRCAVSVEVEVTQLQKSRHACWKRPMHSILQGTHATGTSQTSQVVVILTHGTSKHSTCAVLVNLRRLRRLLRLHQRCPNKMWVPYLVQWSGSWFTVPCLELLLWVASAYAKSASVPNTSAALNRAKSEKGFQE